MADSWNLEAPPGFQGLRDDLPLRVYTRHLPHWRQDGATYFTTFRLADAIPELRRSELERLKSQWQRQNAVPCDRKSLESLAKMAFEKIEQWLDQGIGSCILREERFATCVHQTMQYFHKLRYELGASVVMPNHVHCILRPLLVGPRDLEHILGSWKSYVGRKINAALGRSGTLWQEESYDRIIRDEEHLWNSIQYIGRNPAKANLSGERCRLWINPEWHELGWTFR